MNRTLLPHERGTRIYFGKPYHWHLTYGVLELAAGAVDDCVSCEQIEDAAAKADSLFKAAIQ